MRAKNKVALAVELSILSVSFIIDEICSLEVTVCYFGDVRNGESAV